MKIGVDIMGGDFAPEEPIKAIASFLANHPDQKDVACVLIGSQESAQPFLHYLENFSSQFAFVNSNSVIGMDEHPTKALKGKPDSSIAIGFELLQKGDIDAFISTGNTGAMLVGAMYSVKAIPGISRPTIASLIPNVEGRSNLLLDVGANADCKPEHLVQFAIMGSLYMRLMLELEQPRVGLLNIGEEEGKGNLLAQAAYSLLKDHPGIQFAGNVEGRDLFIDTADVIVCEGFTGNVVLKMAESIYHIFKEKRGFQDEFLESFNYEVYGGTPILGINAPVIIGHGISKAIAIEYMIANAVKLVRTDFVNVLRSHFTEVVEQ